MKSALRITGLLLFTLFTASTVSAQKATGDKHIISKNMEVPPFHSLDISGICEVVLAPGEVQSLVIEAQENVHEKVGIKVEDGMLFLSDKGAAKGGKLLFTVTMPLVNRINISGASNLKGNGVIRGERLHLKSSGAAEITLALDLNQLTTEASGASTMRLAGRAEHHTCTVSGAADLKAMELETQKAEVKVSGAGNARLDVADELISETSGAGDISLKRDPVTRKTSGKGSSATVVSGPGIKIITSQRGDSTVVKIGEHGIEVIDGDSTRVKIGGTGITLDDKGKVTVKKQKKHRFDGHWGGFELGINGLLNAENGFDLLGPDKLNPGYSFLGDINLGKSINVKLNFFEQNFNLVNNRLGLVTGLGLEYANYRFDNNIRLLSDSATVLGFPVHDVAMGYTKSKLVVNYLTLPLILEYQTNRFSKTNSFHISGGIMAGLRIGSHSKLVQESRGKEKLKTRDDFHINPLKYDAMVRIGWGVINLNANYSLNTLFRKDRGPEMYPFTIGLALVSW